MSFRLKNVLIFLKITIFCTCVECGITKTKFVKSQSTGGAIAGSPTKPYCGINKVPKGKHLGTEIECIRQNQIRQYGINKAKLDKSIMKNIKIDPKTAKSIRRYEEKLIVRYIDPKTAKAIVRYEELKQKQQGN